MNNIIITGNLTRDPELKTFNGNTTVVNIDVAVRRSTKNKKTNQYDSDFFRCVAFGKTAEFISSYMAKGDKVAVSGAMQSRNWEKDGVKHTSWEIFANNVERLSPPKQQRTDAQTGFNEVDDDVLPWMDGV